jgi:hypothetical protein
MQRKFLNTMKSVMLLSNGASANSEEKTLSSFSNSIPRDYLNKHRNLKVAVDKIGIDLNLANGATLSPKSKHMPSLIQIPIENWTRCVNVEDSHNNLNISMFDTKNALKLYVNENMHYTPKSLYEHFRRQTINEPVPVKFAKSTRCISFGQFDFNGDVALGYGKSVKRVKYKQNTDFGATYILFSKRLKECLDIPLDDDDCLNKAKTPKLLCIKDGGYKIPTNWEEFTIDGEIYYRLSNEMAPLKAYLIGLYILYQKAFRKKL